MANMYERLLGDSYKKLHPKLQKRYEITEENSFTGEGKMDEIYGGSFFVKLILKIASKFRMFFPERGKKVPFTIHNTAERDEHGNEFVRWNRTFYFRNKKRYFNAVMKFDEYEIVDYYGEPHILVSTLNFHIDEMGAMHISSKKQWFYMFRRKIPLPRFLYGEANIVESYDETKQCFRIHVQVRNPLIGSLLSYRGTFVERK
ncbi:DUF4166 domain-containing protein [Bacillus anthracis]|uniref:DUF4166 domain-containing protein n=1 Tax=Bacillus anthracis TaxID=1392 RepID=UPI0003A130C1|nr:DUF4166 domain-containing protein [Bacillus anthracis]